MSANAFTGMAALGVRPGECVAIVSENRPEWLFVDIGVLHHGAITAAIYVTNAAEQVRYILDHSEARLFFVENEEQLDKYLEVRDTLPKMEKIVVFDMDGLKHFDDPMVMSYEDFLVLGREEEKKNPGLMDERGRAVDADDTAIIVYTSGTTGEPKGAMLTHRNLLWTAKSFALSNPMLESDQILSFLPLCHIAERLFTTFNQLSTGYTVNFAENLETVPHNLREVSPTVFFAVPRIWEKFHSKIELTMREATFVKRWSYAAAARIGRRYAREALNGGGGAASRALFGLAHFAVLHPLKKRLGLERVRFALSGAAPISRDILEYFHGLGLWVREVYGQTEGSGPATVHYHDKIKPGTVGRAIPGVEVRLADDGEILVRGGCVFKGYFKNPEATAETLEDGWLHSGDVGEFDDEGFLRITDRKKDIIINAAGKNLAPAAIENQLKASPYINDAVAIGDRRAFVTALILIDEEQVIKYAQDHRIPFTTYASLARNEEIRKLIAAEVDKANHSLARVEQVKKFSILDKRLDQEDGELTPTMKVKRKKISQLYADVIEAMYRR
ncbi:MAG: long-chain fatty acid--CoA ligase [Deltaproteobacteria bacterium]|nr:long-chain fatty acid--CoA ligase [Deltaproteobacteria bacterium]